MDETSHLRAWRRRQEALTHKQLHPSSLRGNESSARHSADSPFKRNATCDTRPDGHESPGHQQVA
jgi:hypothetical protein